MRLWRYFIALMATCFVLASAATAQAANFQAQQTTNINRLHDQLAGTMHEVGYSQDSAKPTTTQIKSVIAAAQKYFSARMTYEKVLFLALTQDNSTRQSHIQNLELKTKNSELISFFQKYFSSNPTLNLSQLTERRDLLRQIKTLDQGHLSGSVWLYDSPLTSFAISYLDKIDPVIITQSLAQASSYGKKHRYSQAQKIYQNLLDEYSESPKAGAIKVLLTRSVVDGFNYQSRLALDKHDYKLARKYLNSIIEQFPQTTYAAAATKQLNATISVAVNYYQVVADEHFHPAGNIGVPQNKASIYYEKMFEEDKSGRKASLALYYWARALGTEGKVKQEVQLLQQHLEEFPGSEVRAQAMYLLGFTYCNHQLRDYKRGIPLLLQVVKDFPQSEQAPEALWNAAFVLGWNKQYQRAISLLQQLKKEYPKSRRAKYADKWIERYQ